MSRRGRTARGAGGRPSAYDPPRPVGPGAPPEEGRPPLREQLRTATVPAGALLPLRFFFGITFLYAGIDKLIDPTFFDASSPTSIMAQMADFTRVSPLAPLVRAAEPYAVLLGLGIALGEIAVGLGALTGLAYRVAALGGFAVSMLFFLTASWATRPYYFGPDLPYAAGWLVLALAGHGGLLVPRWVRTIGRPGASYADRGASPRRSRGAGWAPGAAADAATAEPGILTRRSLLQVGALAVAAFAVGSATIPVRLLRGGSRGAATGATGGPTPTPGSSPAATPTPAPSAGATGSTGGLAVANVSDLQKADARPFTVPFDAPAPLPAGDPGVIVKLADGSFVAYDTVCTHEGCTVEWDAADAVLLCPCHGAAFDPAAQASVLQGPARQPLAALPIVVDAATGTISLQA